MPQEVSYLHTFFEKQADIRPNDPALIGLQEIYSYRELDEYSNQVAHYLRLKGVNTGDMVGLYFNRSELPIIAILAILKAGAGYVPLDPAYPKERIEHIINDASVRIVLSEESLSSKSAVSDSITVLKIDKCVEEIRTQPVNRIDPVAINHNDSNLCYIIYTSGSTGRPKGVMTEHRNIVNFVKSFKKECKLTPQDRVYQGFSFGFDGSVEEMWMAYASGSVLVTANNDIAGMPNDAAEYMTSNKVTYFSTVPTFLSMINSDLPTVRLLVVSGEACPQEIVDKWAYNGRRMLNVYGPTEATVNTTVAECRANKKVTIGKPLDGYEIFILDEYLQPVPEGTQGELYIAGPTLSRGYMNLAEMTEKAFIPTPVHIPTKHGRLYKTGDLVSLNEDRELFFYGRKDHQVKIRGYRIELSEIEAVLREHPSVHASAVKAYQDKTSTLTELAAYIVCKNGTSVNRGKILALLKKKLPSYMVPSYLDIIDELPILTSGKTDRSRLPDPVAVLVDTDRAIIEPSTETQKKIASVWKDQFKTQSISIQDNFFTDLGGYSLIAAHTVSALRNTLGCEIAIRDVYTYPTITQLSAHIDANSKNNKIDSERKLNTNIDRELSSEVFKRIPILTRWSCYILQALSAGLLYSFPVAGILLSIIIYDKVKSGNISFEQVGLITLLMVLFLYPVMLFVSIVTKWVIIGKFKPGNYPLWGWYYFRWWLVTRVYRLCGASFLAGTPLMSLYLRMMGARIGKNTIVNTSHCTIFDSLTIGDNTTIGFEAQINGYRVEDGLLKIGTIKIGSNCFVGIQASVSLNCIMNDRACLDDLSLLSDHETMASDESRRGSPSKPGTIMLPLETDVKKGKPINGLFFSLLSLLSVYFVELFLFIVALPSVAIIYYSFKQESWTRWIALLLASAILFELTFWIVLLLMKRLIMFKAKPGTYYIRSIYYLRKWTIDSLLAMSRLLTLPIYTTLYAIPLLRMLGIKIGKRAELSVLGYISPDLVSLGDESFFADGSLVGGFRLYNGVFELAENRIGSRTFIGNSALIPAGNSVGDNCLVGVLSVPPADIRETPSDSEWLGSPSFKLPHRKKVEGFKEKEIYRPTFGMILSRLCIDALRILIPSVIEIASLVGYIILTHSIYKSHGLFIALMMLPIIGTGIVFGMVFCVVLVKNGLIGTYKPVIKPLWSPYVWLNEAVNGSFESIAAPVLMPLLGTPFISGFLRMLGVKIGKNVFVETLLFGEFDLVEIGDYAALNFDVIVQNHLFEDRIFKASHLKIGDNCSIGNMSVILYDTEMGTGSSIGPLSLLMKGESISPKSQWQGIPMSTV